MNLVAEILPEVVGQTDFTLLAITFAPALGRIQRFADGIDDLRNMDVTVAASQPVTAARAAHAADQLALAQFGEQLFDNEMSCRLEISLRLTGASVELMLKSSIAVTA